MAGPFSDRRLVARVRAGDEAAFERLFDRYAPGLLSFCRHMLGSREEAEDAVQHVFLAAHRALLGSDREMQLRAWLYAIARNRCLSMLRARRDELAIDDVDPGRVSTAGLSAEVERRQDLRDLVADVQRLPDDQRAALVLAELGAHSHEEIAEILDVRKDKVKALVFQAREALAGARHARDLPCEEVREQLATLRGGALRRAPLRRHVEVCAGCRAFRDEVARQRAAMALILPVVPAAALKASVLGGGSAAAAGSLLFGAKGAATKLLAIAAVTGTAGGGGYVAVHELRDREGAATPPAARAAERPANRAAPAAAGATPSAPTATTTPTPGAARPKANKAKKAPGMLAPLVHGAGQPTRGGPPSHAGTPARDLAPGRVDGPARDAALGRSPEPARQVAPGRVKQAGEPVRGATGTSDRAEPVQPVEAAERQTNGKGGDGAHGRPKDDADDERRDRPPG
jgi:RNA polymerase sigma factor (sigma-70 family)